MVDDLSKALAFARQYLYQSLYEGSRGPLEEYALHRQLRHRLCLSLERIEREFGEVTRKDIVLCIEAWMMAQAGIRPEEPLEHRVLLVSIPECLQDNQL